MNNGGSSSSGSTPLTPADQQQFFDHAYSLIAKLPTTGPAGKIPKLLKAMLDFAPTSGGKMSIASDIMQTKDLSVLADHYVTAIILPVRASGGKSRPVVGTPTRDEDFGGLEPVTVSPASRAQAKLKAATLLRDNYRCLATARVDYVVLTDAPSKAGTGGVFDTTQAAHVLPFGLNDFTDPKEAEMVWTALGLYVGKALGLTKLIGTGINSVDNAMTLCSMAHKLFGELKLAFEPVDGHANQYNLRWFGIPPVPGFPTSVTFQSVTTDLVPNADYLALHCAVAKVYNAVKI